MNADGSRQHVLFRSKAGDYEPDWSPDGRRIAFVGYQNENYNIDVMNADGSGVTQLTSGPDYEPDWSPDGRSIAARPGTTTSAGSAATTRFAASAAATSSTAEPETTVSREA